ncbi:MAG: NAD(+)/NADH kinase [Thermoguttaceae bacterium]|jgi:NAD+ kinase
MNPVSGPWVAPPPDRPLRVVLLSAGQRPHVAAEAERLRAIITRHAQIVGVDFTGQEDMSTIDADVAIVLGGDGSILRAAHQMGHRQLPAVAVNLGRLGFLADVAPEELSDILGDLRAGKLSVVEHLMLDCRVLPAGQPELGQLVLNEVAVRAGSPFVLMDISLYVDSEWVTTYSGDGLIISTPVGSTAYSLSAGGPILRKDLEALVIVPLSPHTLTNRPVVESADRLFEMEVLPPCPEASVVVDGRVLGRIKPGERVRVTRAPVRFRMVTAPGHSYYHTLREKLGWSGHLRRNDGRGNDGLS